MVALGDSGLSKYTQRKVVYQEVVIFSGEKQLISLTALSGLCVTAVNERAYSYMPVRLAVTFLCSLFLIGVCLTTTMHTYA